MLSFSTQDAKSLKSRGKRRAHYRLGVSIALQLYYTCITGAVAGALVRLHQTIASMSARRGYYRYDEAKRIVPSGVLNGRVRP